MSGVTYNNYKKEVMTLSQWVKRQPNESRTIQTRVSIETRERHYTGKGTRCTF